MSGLLTERNSVQIMDVFFLCDTSGSMQGKRLSAQNHAINFAVQQLRSRTQDVQKTKIIVQLHAIQYNTHASWHLANQPLISLSAWPELTQAQGITNLGQAYKLLGQRLKSTSSETSHLPPVIVLISDGKPTDDDVYWLEQLLSTPLGRQSQRIAIGMGHDISSTSLNRFDSNQNAIMVRQFTELRHQLTNALWQSIQQNYVMKQSSAMRNAA